MGKSSVIRVWQEVETSTVFPHLLIAGTLDGSCGNCQEMGLPFSSVKCPKCGNYFKYMATRLHSSVREAKRLHQKRPDLILIELKDLKEIEARGAAHELWGD